MARKLSIEIVGDASSLQKAFRTADSSSAKFGRGLQSLGKIATVGLGAAFAGLAATLKVGFDEIAESQKVIAQTGAVLKSTGQAANVTAKDVENLAGSLSRMSGVDDEAIQAGETMLLTFTRIRDEVGKGNDIFKQATAATLDLSVAMGKDMQSSAILVGKALNDPLKGMTALSKAGIQFTAEQKKTIESLVESGKTMEAQKLILTELTTQFGGSAKAFGETLPGQLSKLKNSFSEVAANIAETLLPYLTRLTEWTNDHMPQIQKVIQAALDGVVFTMTKVVAPAVEVVIAAFRAIAEAAERFWPRVKAAAQAFADWYRDDLEPTIHSVTRRIVADWDKGGEEMQGSTRNRLGGLPPIIQAQMRNAMSVLNAAMALLRGDWGAAWREMLETPVRTLNALVDTGKMFLNDIANIAAAIGNRIESNIVRAMNGVAIATRWIGTHAAPLWDRAMSGIAKAVDAVMGPLSKFYELVDAIRRAVAWILEKAPEIPSIKVPSLPSIPGIPRPKFRQHGGPVWPRESFIVGEKGPELFRPSLSGTIVPNNRLAGASAGGGTVVHQHFHIAGSVIAERELLDIVQRQAADWRRRNGSGIF